MNASGEKVVWTCRSPNSIWLRSTCAGLLARCLLNFSATAAAGNVAPSMTPRSCGLPQDTRNTGLSNSATVAKRRPGLVIKQSRIQRCAKSTNTYLTIDRGSFLYEVHRGQTECSPNPEMALPGARVSIERGGREIIGGAQGLFARQHICLTYKLRRRGEKAARRAPAGAAAFTGLIHWAIERPCAWLALFSWLRLFSSEQLFSSERPFSSRRPFSWEQLSSLPQPSSWEQPSS